MKLRNCLAFAPCGSVGKSYCVQPKVEKKAGIAFAPGCVTCFFLRNKQAKSKEHSFWIRSPYGSHCRRNLSASARLLRMSFLYGKTYAKAMLVRPSGVPLLGFDEAKEGTSKQKAKGFNKNKQRIPLSFFLFQRPIRGRECAGK